MKSKEFRHHYVPQFLMKKFSIYKVKRKNDDDYPIYVYDTELDKERVDIPRNILYKKFLNSFKIDQIREFVKHYQNEYGEAPSLSALNITAGYEDAWSRFDRYVSSIYQELKTEKVDVELRALVSFYFSGSYFRNIKFINKMRFHNDFLKESYYEFAEKYNKEYNFDSEVLNDEELKYFYYQFVFTDKEMFQLFTEYFPVILESDSKFLLGDNPIVILHFYKDYLNGIGTKEKGVFSLTPIDKNRTIMLLPLFFIDKILDIFDVLNNDYECIDVTNGLIVHNRSMIKIVKYVIDSLLSPGNESESIPLVRYKCNDRDIELLNFFQLANSHRLIIYDQPMQDAIKNYFNKKPILKQRNERKQSNYVKYDENSVYEYFRITDQNDLDNNQDTLFQISENRIVFNDLPYFYRTIIFKIQKSMRVGFDMIKEKRFGDILQVRKSEIR